MEKVFKLDSMPTAYQLSIHVNNLIKYFRPGNSRFRMFRDEKAELPAEHIINLMKSMCCNPKLTASYLEQRHSYPIECRIATIVNYYGYSTVFQYMMLIYKDSKVA